VLAATAEHHSTSWRLLRRRRAFIAARAFMHICDVRNRALVGVRGLTVVEPAGGSRPTVLASPCAEWNEMQSARGRGLRVLPPSCRHAAWGHVAAAVHATEEYVFLSFLYMYM
jgi:hypothetical protein